MEKQIKVYRMYYEGHIRSQRLPRHARIGEVGQSVQDGRRGSMGSQGVPHYTRVGEVGQSVRYACQGVTGGPTSRDGLRSRSKSTECKSEGAGERRARGVPPHARVGKVGQRAQYVNQRGRRRGVTQGVPHHVRVG